MLFIAIVLGIVQGIGEFLPISSSAHLIIVRWLFDWETVLQQASGTNIDLVLDVALHLGTLIAVVVFFFKDWLRLAQHGLTKGAKTEDGRMFWYLVIATIPGALMGFLLESVVEGYIRTQYLVIAVGLAVMGVILYYVDKNSKQTVTLDRITMKQALWVGVAQIFALMPGVSRSGVTMTAGRYLGFTRETAAKFSFLLATPIIAGAALKQSKAIIHNITNPLFLIGTITAAIVGIWCIGFLLKYLKKNNFAIFMWYRLAIAIVIFIVYFARGY